MGTGFLIERTTEAEAQKWETFIRVSSGNCRVWQNEVWQKHRIKEACGALVRSTAKSHVGPRGLSSLTVNWWTLGGYGVAWWGEEVWLAGNDFGFVNFAQSQLVHIQSLTTWQLRVACFPTVENSILEWAAHSTVPDYLTNTHSFSLGKRCILNL